MKRISILSQVYPPDEAAVGQLMEDIARDVVQEGCTVRVVTSIRGFDDPRRRYAAFETRNGVEVRRVRTPAAPKTHIPRRFAAGLWYAVSAASRLLAGVAPDVFVLTGKPMGALFGAMVARIRGARTVYWLTDINPDQAIAAGVLRPDSWSASVFRVWAGLAMRSVDVVITLDDDMRQRITAYGVLPSKLVVIPPWSSIAGPPSQRDVSDFRRREGWQDRTVVMYAGNHSPVHPLDTLLDGASERPSGDRLMFVFAGGGSIKPSIDARASANIRTRPYSPREQVPLLLSSADVHVVAMGASMRGIVHPSKLYGALAAGRPILLIGDVASAVGRVVQENGLGWIVAHGDAAGMRRTLDEIAALSSVELWEKGARARAAFERDHNPLVHRRAFVSEVMRLAGATG